MLFEKLIEQHRIHRIVADRVRLAVGISHNQIAIYLFHLLSHESKLQGAMRINALSCSGR